MLDLLLGEACPERVAQLLSEAAPQGADRELICSRYGVTKLERYESREQLVDLLETVVT